MTDRQKDTRLKTLLSQKPRMRTEHMAVAKKIPRRVVKFEAQYFQKRIK